MQLLMLMLMLMGGRGGRGDYCMTAWLTVPVKGFWNLMLELCHRYSEQKTQQQQQQQQPSYS